jgi:hypothetical protein
LTAKRITENGAASSCAWQKVQRKSGDTTARVPIGISTPRPVLHRRTAAEGSESRRTPRRHQAIEDLTFMERPAEAAADVGRDTFRGEVIRHAGAREYVSARPFQAVRVALVADALDVGADGPFRTESPVHAAAGRDARADTAFVVPRLAAPMDA